MPSRPGTSLGAVTESPVDVFAPGSVRGTPGLKDVLKVSFFIAYWGILRRESL